MWLLGQGRWWQSRGSWPLLRSYCTWIRCQRTSHRRLGYVWRQRWTGRTRRCWNWCRCRHRRRYRCRSIRCWIRNLPTRIRWRSTCPVCGWQNVWRRRGQFVFTCKRWWGRRFKEYRFGIRALIVFSFTITDITFTRTAMTASIAEMVPGTVCVLAIPRYTRAVQLFRCSTTIVTCTCI